MYLLNVAMMTEHWRIALLLFEVLAGFGISWLGIRDVIAISSKQQLNAFLRRDVKESPSN